MLDQVAPGFPFGVVGVVGLAGFGKQRGVSRRQFGELGRNLGLEAGAQERIGELVRLGEQGGEALRELGIGDALQADPGAPDGIGRRQLGLQGVLPAAEDGRV